MGCLFEKLDISTNSVYLIPVRDKRGVPQHKFLQVKAGGSLYNKLMEMGGKLPKFIQEVK